MNKETSMRTILWVFAIALITAGVVYVALQTGLVRLPERSETKTIGQMSESGQPVREDWREYRNTGMGYSVQHPTAWVVEADQKAAEGAEAFATYVDYFKGEDVGSPLALSGTSRVWITILAESNPEKLTAAQWAEKTPGVLRYPGDHVRYPNGAALSEVSTFSIGDATATFQTIDSTKVDGIEGALTALVYVTAGDRMYFIESLFGTRGEFIDQDQDFQDFVLSFRTIDADQETTYSNTTHGYSFTLPDGWVQKDIRPEAPSFNSPRNEEILKQIEKSGEGHGEGYFPDLTITYADSISVYAPNRDSATTLSEYFTNDSAVAEVKPIIFAGLPAYSAIVGGFGTYYTIFVEHSNHIYELNFGDRETPTADQQTIIDSFKFL